MPIGTRSTLKVYDPRTQGAYRERNAQMIEAFNAASAGTIKLSSASKPGDYDISAFFRRQSGMITRRDPTSVAAKADAVLTQDENVNVKLNRSIGPVAITADALRKIGQNTPDNMDPEDGLMFGLGSSIADFVAEEKLNIAISACVAAMLGQATAIFDTYGVAGGVTSDKLNSTLFKRGDRSSDVKAWVMHSAKVAELVSQQVATNATGIASVVLQGGTPMSFNRPILVTDSPSLILTGSPDKYYTLGLTEDAITLEDTEEEMIIGDWVTGLDNLAMRLQGEYAYNLGIEGFSYNTAAGVNPSNAAVATTANWVINVQSIKSIAGVLLSTR